ncbi:MAG: SNF2-related protein [Pseudomonadota bacterium]|nr:SNF2-related protein [Pseudomonadota bacterium]
MPVEDFELGQTVRLRADTAREGAIVAALPSIGDEARYRVFHGPREIRDYFASQLIAVSMTAEEGTFNALFDSDACVDAEQFLARLTAARLSHPQVDAIYSLYAARVQHIPFQFKPLLRLLRADRPRILIADEVGVGKTIETGLILKELQTRGRLDTVLIVCPKSLTTKWRAEMRRFDEEFMILGPDELRYCLREAHLDGAWPAHYGRAIVNLEAIRNEEYLRGVNGRVRRPGMLELDPAPQFDFLIVDEAHHIRNPETNSYEVVRYLRASANRQILMASGVADHPTDSGSRHRERAARR